MVSRSHVLESDELATATAALVRSSGPWDLFVTLTTRRAEGPEALATRYRALLGTVEGNRRRGLGLRRHETLWYDRCRIRHVLAWEPQRRGAWHLHALWKAPGLERVRPRWINGRWSALCRPGGALVQQEWAGVAWLRSRDAEQIGRRLNDLHGICRAERVETGAAVAAYCAKYVVKGGQVDLAI